MFGIQAHQQIGGPCRGDQDLRHFAHRLIGGRLAAGRVQRAIRIDGELDPAQDPATRARIAQQGLEGKLEIGQGEAAGDRIGGTGVGRASMHRLVNADLVAAAALGAVHSLVGLVDQLHWRARAARQHRQTDAAGDAQALHFAHGGAAFTLDAPTHALGELFGHALRHAAQDQAELFATVAAHQIGGARAFEQLLGHFLDHAVADQVAVAVVDDLEVVDVDHHAAQRLLGAPGFGQRRFQRSVEGAPVQAAAKRIARRQPFQLGVLALDFLPRRIERVDGFAQALVGAVQFGDVVEGHQAAAHGAAGVRDRRAVDDQLTRIVAAAPNFEGDARDGAALRDRARPGVRFDILRQALAEPGQAGEAVADAQRSRLLVQAAESFVGQQHARARIHHHHAFGHRIEGALHPLGNHRRRIQVL